ncbi:uncharacterized protein LOC124500135 [Dermatophagoides farinae]|uniref:uncharacterized protein LOC124500135 n=1 Tax=Dermatophagoides farinae TaxID=6954 RepID=UPI003F601270
MSSNSTTSHNLVNMGKNDKTTSSTPSGSNNLKTIISAAILQNTVRDSTFDDNCPRRRASSRSIKRKKFDDELVDSASTSYPRHQKPERKFDFGGEYSESGGGGYNETIITTHHNEPPTPLTPAATTTIISSKRQSSKPSSSISTPASIATVPEKKKKNKKRTIVTSQYVEENNFWKPTDDLALIINVEQTNNLRKVYNGVKFSSKFTFSDVEQRWRSLLYDKNVKNLALAAIRQLHSDIVQFIESRALFSDAEEELLKKLESCKEPALESLQELIDMNAEVFLPSRTPKTLLKHWRLLRHYSLLGDQSLQPQARHESVVSFSEIENTIKKELQEELKNNELATNAAAESDEPVVHNIVATANFNCRLELSKIVTRVRNAEYNPKRFCAVIMRIFEPRTTAMLFASGKIVVTGAKNERLACLACRKYGRIVQKLGYDVKFSEFKVQNIVSTVDMKFPIRLDKLAIYHGQFCTYDPDFFPALIYRMVRPRTVLLIFVSGKLIITGARSRTEMMETMEHIGPVLCSYRK